MNDVLYRCFLDASKAFDRVNHSVLFDKLVQRGVPGYIVTILCYWYAHQTMCVRWDSSISSSFRVSNGVRQDGTFFRHICLMCMSTTYVRSLTVVELGVCQVILLLII